MFSSFKYIIAIIVFTTIVLGITAYKSITRTKENVIPSNSIPNNFNYEQKRYEEIRKRIENSKIPTIALNNISS